MIFFPPTTPTGFPLPLRRGADFPGAKSISMAENPRKTKGNVEVPNTTPSRPLSSAKHTSYGYRREIVSRSSFHLAAQFCLRETEPVQVDLEIKSLENHSLEKRIKLIKLKNHKKSIGFSRKAKKLGTCDV